MQRRNIKIPPPEFYDADQLAARTRFTQFLKGDERIISLIGRAGHGKTTLARAFVHDAIALNYDIVLTALTHEAASVLSDAVGLPARTIHSHLRASLADNHETGDQNLVVGGDEVFEEDEPKFLGATLVLVDEGSMMDNAILQGCAQEAKQFEGMVKYLIVGDRHQIPSVKEGKPGMAVVPARAPWDFIELTKPHRAALDHPVTALALATCDADDPRRLPTPETNIVEREGEMVGVLMASREQFQQRLLTRVDEAVRSGDISSVRAITFTNAAAGRINKAIRHHLYGSVLASKVPYLEGEMLCAHSQYTAMTIESMRDEHPTKVTLNNGRKLRVDAVRAVADWRPPALPSEYGEAREYKMYELAVTVVSRQGKPLRGVPQLTILASGSYEERDAEIERLQHEGTQLRDVHWPQARNEGVPGALRWRKPFMRKFQYMRRVIDVRPVWASTAHKAQGQTIENVYIPLGDFNKKCFDPQLKRALLYTSYARSSKRLVITHA